MTIDRKDFSINDTDDELDVLALRTYLDDESERKKAALNRLLDDIGEDLLLETEKKQKNKKLKQIKLIPYILKHRSDVHTKEELMSYSFEDVQDIYNQTKLENKSSILKFIHFIFNIE